MPGPQRRQAKNLSAASEVCRRLVEDEDYLKALKARLIAGDVPPATETMLWAYAYGKPVEVLEVSTTDDLRRSFVDLEDADFKARGEAILRKIEAKLAVTKNADELFKDVPPVGGVQ